jgi:glycosyltransferase involved in cell wall biosynthesis
VGESTRKPPPLISICVPNLNTRPYLDERLETIRAQTYPHWEMIVSDNGSEDGAWEFLQEAGRRDARISLAQAPKEGMYANWNRCLRRATGQYVYIATSDDTMAPDCLEKMVGALESHPECGLAHCMLKVIGDGAERLQRWWDTSSMFARSSGELRSRPHVRPAPFDGLLHFSGDSVYISVTQLLIRRSLFTEVGLFENQWGSEGDFNWNMRASLLANTVHVPDTWGGWRLHAAQATQIVKSPSNSESRLVRVNQMIDHAVAATRDRLEPEVRDRIQGEWASLAADMRRFTLARHRLNQRSEKLLMAVWEMVRGSAAARRYLAGRFRSDWVPWPLSMPSIARAWLQEAGMSIDLRA